MKPSVDLTNCDREPIHIPGSIQPHGCLSEHRDDEGEEEEKEFHNAQNISSACLCAKCAKKGAPVARRTH